MWCCFIILCCKVQLDIAYLEINVLLGHPYNAEHMKFVELLHKFYMTNDCHAQPEHNSISECGS